MKRSVLSTLPLPLSLSLGLSDFPCDIISNISPHPNIQSGYQIVPLPLYSGSLAPDAPTDQGTQTNDQTPPTSTGADIVGHTRKDTEPIAVTIQNWNHTAVFSRGGNGEYLTFWYAGQIPDDAVSRVGGRFTIPSPASVLDETEKIGIETLIT